MKREAVAAKVGRSTGINSNDELDAVQRQTSRQCSHIRRVRTVMSRYWETYVVAKKEHAKTHAHNEGYHWITSLANNIRRLAVTASNIRRVHPVQLQGINLIKVGGRKCNHRPTY